jgi:hypothetical protein
MNANVRQQLFNQEALMKNTYKIMKKPIHTLVVNLPIAYSTTSPRNNSSKRLRHTSKRQKSKTRAKSDLSNESKLCYDQKREKHPLFIQYFDLKLQNRSIK